MNYSDFFEKNFHCSFNENIRNMDGNLTNHINVVLYGIAE